jgi:galactose-1-phosphate uridylyltransferase
MRVVMKEATRPIEFNKRQIRAQILSSSGDPIERLIEVRNHPLSYRNCRITFSRSSEMEAGTEALPSAPPNSHDSQKCPFCQPQLHTQTPRLAAKISAAGRLVEGESILFPNLFPYSCYSAVSLIDYQHFVEIGRASPASYTSSLINCGNYIKQILNADPHAVYAAVAQNHLPSAGGSLIHPHFQVHMDPFASNHHHLLEWRTKGYFQQYGRHFFSDYLALEIANQDRYIGCTGKWEWLAAFAPEGFYEIWGILPEHFSLQTIDHSLWQELAQGIINAQHFYRSLHRNGYNLGLLSIEQAGSCLELRVVLIVRSNYAPWVRNDHTSFEVMLGDMATFSAPEETARLARPFWNAQN